jgi:hypothetical protein
VRRLLVLVATGALLVGNGWTTAGPPACWLVHRDVVDDVIVLLRTAHGTRFPITQARPIDDFGGDDDASMAADNSSGFNCRRVAGTSTWSEHGYGRAIDINPVANT